MDQLAFIDHSLAPALASLMLGPATASAGDVPPTDDAAPPNEQTMATVNASPHLDSADAQSTSKFRISVVAMTGAAIVIENASAADTTLSVKRRVFALNNQLHVHWQRLMYRPGPFGINPLLNDETLGGAGVTEDGSAELDVLLVDLTAEEDAEFGSRLLDASMDGFSDEIILLF